MASNAIDEMEAYLEYPNKQKEAENVLGSLSDRLTALGFVETLAQTTIAEEVCVLTNQLGGEDNVDATL